MIILFWKRCYISRGESNNIRGNVILILKCRTWYYNCEIAVSGTQHHDYRVPICALTGCMFAYVIVIAAIRPEKLGRDMAEDNIDNASSDNEPELPVSNATRMSHPRF